jgi:cob(I)alamin adenosyltransferase
MVLKSHPRVQSYGEVDELNSVIGIVIAHASENNLNAIVFPLNSIQQRLFDLGAQLATPANAEPKGINVIKEIDVTNLENLIDQACENLPELTSFVLPGGHIVNAYLHLARTVCRRLERTLVELKNNEPIGDFVLEYVNRLSDYLFALAFFLSSTIIIRH